MCKLARLILFVVMPFVGVIVTQLHSVIQNIQIYHKWIFIRAVKCSLYLYEKQVLIMYTSFISKVDKRDSFKFESLTYNINKVNCF